MRWTVAVSGTICLILALVLVYAGMRASSGDQSEQAIREALKAQLRLVESDLQDSVLRSQELAVALVKTDAKDQAAISKIFGQIEAPELMLIREGKEVRELVSEKYVRTVPAVKALTRHLKSEQPWSFWQDLDRKPFILYRGLVEEKEFAALFELPSVFSRIARGGAIRPWIALADSRIVHHSEERFVGQKAGNVRPVALGSLNMGKDHRIEMIARYVGITGNEVLGTWASLPQLQMIVGTEWPSSWWGKKSSSYLTWIAGILFFVGAFLFGFAVTPRPILVTEAKRELKDLSHEARTFIKKAETEVARAYEFARERDTDASSLEARAREQLSYVKRTRWIFEKTEGFFDEVMESETESEVWKILGRYLSDMAWKAPLVVFSHSNATHSLLPENFTNGADEFSDSATRYLAATRILVGDSRKIVNLEQTEAYQKWLERLNRHLKLDEWQLFHLPFASQTGSKGVVLFFIRAELFDQKEIEQQRELWNLFAHRAAWLYDLKRRLIQSSYGAKRSKQHLAGAPN